MAHCYPRITAPILAAALLLTTNVVAITDAAAAAAYRKAGYFTRSATDFNGRDFQIRDLDQKGSAAKLTHLLYAFGDVSPEGMCHFTNGDAWHDYQKRFDAARSVDSVADRYEQPLAGNFNQIKKLKAIYGMRTSVSIGGGSRSRYFSDAALTATSRSQFVASCLDLYIKGNLPQINGEPQGGPGTGYGVFDGVDIDWEYPGSPGNNTIYRPEDKQNFTLLLAEFRRQLDEYGQQTGKYYLLTASLAGSTYRIDRGYELPTIFTYLDWATVMTYDMHGAWESPLITNHHAALYHNPSDPSDVPRSCQIYVDNFLNAGVAASQLVLGFPFYSRGWTGVTNQNNGLFQHATGATTPDADDYKNVKNLHNNGYTRYWDNTAKAAWLFNGTTFWTFDDTQVAEEKTAYVRATGLGGVGMWAMHSDDDQGSLATAIANGLP